MIETALKQITDSLKILRDQKVIRTHNFVGELGEYYCKRHIGIELSPTGQQGYDGVDIEGKRVQIKTRCLTNSENKTKKISFKNFDFDYCLYIDLQNNYSLKGIYKLSKRKIKIHIKKDNKGGLYLTRSQIIKEGKQVFNPTDSI